MPTIGKSSAFSMFIREAGQKEKEAVYRRVLKAATEAQKRQK